MRKKNDIARNVRKIKTMHLKAEKFKQKIKYKTPPQKLTLFN